MFAFISAYDAHGIVLYTQKESAVSAFDARRDVGIKVYHFLAKKFFSE